MLAFSELLMGKIVTTKFTLHQLRVFQQVANTQSITRAAEHLFMTPPAVIKQIKNLAELLAVSLFETMGKKVFLTKAGQQLLVDVTPLLQQADQLRMKLLTYKNQPEQKIKLSVINTFQELFFKFLKQYRDSYPLTEFEISVVPFEEQKKQFDDKSFDFYCGGDINLAKSKYVIDIFDRFKFILAAPKGHELSGKLITEKILARYQFITGSAASGSQQQQEKIFKRLHLQRPLIRVDSYGAVAVAAAISAGLGIGLLPDNIAAAYINKGECVELSFAVPGRQYPVMLIRHKTNNMSEVMSMFRQCFLQYNFRGLK